jgi:Xaa-Pro aminopeptidase
MRSERLAKLRGMMAKSRLDALLITSLPNIFYLSGFTGDTAAMLVTRDRSVILLDPRYTEQGREECEQVEVAEFFGKPLTHAISDQVGELVPGVLGFEKQFLSYSDYLTLRKLCARSIRLKGVSGLVEDPNESALIKHACGIVDSVFEEVSQADLVGKTERDVDLMILNLLRRHGARKESFDTIAAYGPHSAKPHCPPDDTVIHPGAMLKLDFGALYKGYCSDITRTIFIGEPSLKFQEIYGIVLEAQLAAIAAIEPGKPGKEVDAVARKIITDAGYREKFGHGTGHQIGIEVHDGPGLSLTSDIVLEPGVVVSVEPGIYIEGWGGVRIEDDVLVTHCGREVLTRARK